jgi:hypothetical protein
MSHVDRTALAASTINRKWFVNVNTGTYAIPVWTAVNGIMEFKGAKETTLQDDSDMDNGGWKSSTATALSWSLEFKVKRAPTVAVGTAYDTGQEALRTYSDLEGTANKADVQFFEVTASGPIAEAYRGYAVVSWSPDGGGMDAADTVTITLTGIGARTPITHPDGTAVVPTLLSVDPATGIQAGGTLHKLIGTGFMLAGVDNIVASTGIKLGGSGGTAMPYWRTESDNVAYFVAPAITAGSKDVVVYNAVGISTVHVHIAIT